MEIEHLFILQIIAHLLTDYTFQTDKKAKEKNREGFKSKFLKWHVLVAFFISLILSFQVTFILGAAAIALTHWFIDGIKIYINKNKFLGRFAYFIDQLLHLFFIVTIVFLFDRFFELNPVVNIAFNSKYLVMIAGFLFCTKPANIFIKEIFKFYNISIRKNGEPDNELPNAGKLIGIIERLLILVFILINQFEAVGFLIAAKSLLRFRDNESLKTEYVLIGTMLSFASALAIGLIINEF